MGRRNWKVVWATDEHAHALAPRMRQEDADEVLASGGYLPLEALLVSIHNSTVARTLLIGGEPAALFGAAPWPNRPHVGIAWALTSDLVDRHPREFWRACRQELPALLTTFAVLANFVDARYTRSIRWLAHLGARFAREPQPFGKAKLPFYYFSIHREDLFPCAKSQP